MADILERYFSYLMFRKNHEITTKPLPKINRKMITIMKDYYKIIDNDGEMEKKNAP